MKTVLAIAIGVALSLGVVAGYPKGVKASELPAAVVNTIKQNAPDAKIIDGVKETPTDTRTPYYTVAVETNGQRLYFMVDENGKLLRPAQTPRAIDCGLRLEPDQAEATKRNRARIHSIVA